MSFLVGFSIAFLWAHLGQFAARAVGRKEGRVESLCLFVVSTFLLIWWLVSL